MKKILILIIAALSLCACDHSIVISEFRSLPLSGWDKDSLLTFTYEIEDTLSSYDIILYLRHTNSYPYQNIWLFVEDEGKDTIEFYLADQRGRWLGNGYSDVCEMPVLYKQERRYDHAGQYDFLITHGMRDEILTGVSDVGIKIIKNE